MKNLLKLVFVLVAGIVVSSFAGCKNYDEEINQLDLDMTTIEQKVSVLETLKNWAEGQVSTLGGKDANLQSQIDALNSALNAANTEIDALKGRGGNPEAIAALESKLNALIAGSTLTIAQIESRLKALETADYQAQIDALYLLLDEADYSGQIEDLQAAIEAVLSDHQDQLDALNMALEVLGAGDLTAVLEQIADLEERLEALTVGDLLTEEDIEAWFEANYGTDIDDLWEAIESIEPTDLTELENRIADLEEAIAGLWQGLIQSITYLPSSAEVTVDGIEDEDMELIDLNAFTLEFLVTPAAGAALLDESMVEGIFNTYTRTLGATVPVTSVEGNGNTGVLAVTFDPDPQAPMEETLQIALRVALESGENLTSGFVDLAFGTMTEGHISRDITLGEQFYQGDVADNVTVTTYATEEVDLAADPELKIADTETELTLDLQAENLENLRGSTITYAVEKQYEREVGATDWEEVSMTATTVSGVLTIPGSVKETLVIVKLTITSIDLAVNPFVTYFAVTAAAKIDLDAATFTAASDLTRGSDNGNALVNAAAYDGDHTVWGGDHFLWDDDHTNAVLTLDFADQLAALFPTAAGATVGYVIVNLHNAEGNIVTDVNQPLQDVVAGNAVFDRNNTVYGKSNTGHFMVVKVILNAANAIAPATHFYCFEMLNGEPEEPVVPEEPVDDFDFNGLIPKLNLEGRGDLTFMTKEELEDIVVKSTAWGGNNQTGNLGNTVLVADKHTDELALTGIPLTLEDQLKALYDDADFVVEYNLIEQSKLNSGRWVTDLGAGNENRAAKVENGVIILGEKQANSGGAGFRLVIEIIVTATPGSVLTGNAEDTGSVQFVTYTCVTIPDKR
jgi:peptidoglycan hydrolase CwlO-like protein